MNEMNDKNEIIKDKNEQDEKDFQNINNIEIDPSKYNLDYTVKFNSINTYINSIAKQKFLIQLFLSSSKINMFNKIISLDKLYTIIDSENNITMIYSIVSKILNYMKIGRMSTYMLNTNIFFCSEFLSNNQNYYFAHIFFSELKKINDNISFDKKLTNEVSEFIKTKIDYFEKYFISLVNIEQISELNKIINNILNQNDKEKKEENEIEAIENINNNYVYAINKTWLQNAKIFIGNYLFAKETQALKQFFDDAFDKENVLSLFLSDQKIDKAIGNKTYYPFPGPINNFPITDFKYMLLDPIIKEENYLIKKHLIPQLDYYWINHKDWTTLKDAFSCTNEIKRKKTEIEMIQINAFIFYSGIRKYKNESVNFMKKRVIHISKTKSIKDFEIKIMRCLEHELGKKINENINENIVYLYKMNKKNRDIIIEMFLSFIIDIQNYESVFINEINFSEEEKKNKIEDIFKKYNPKKEILIIEICDKKINQKFINPIMPKLNKNNENKFYCSICSGEINNLNNINNICKLCSMYIYCSEKCANINNNQENIKIKEHYKLHKFLSELILKPFKLKDFLSESFYNQMYTLENMEKSKGVAGLYNLGNTCYMNCSLQCLSNTKDLTKYFINNNFQNEINLQTTFGSNGVLVKSYSDLLNLLWFSKFIKINPSFFRMAFCMSTHKFMNNNQQDAMDFILILLNYLHEDLNRIKAKPYSMFKEQQIDESDVLASQRAYNYYQKRDNSIIMDLFNGQFQNKIKCATCFTEKKTYEPFMNVCLPIPEKHNFYIIKFFTNLNCKYITMKINSETSFEDLLKKASNYLSKKILDSINAIKKEYKNNSKNDQYLQDLLKQNIEIVKLDKNKIINEIYIQPDDNNNQLKEYIDDGEEIVLFEKELIPDYHQNIYVYPITTNPKNEDEINYLSYPVVFSVKHDLTLENLEKEIVEKLNHIIKKDFNIKNNHIIDLHILHSNRNKNTGIFKIVKDYEKCIFCTNDYGVKKYCPLYFFFDKNDTVSKIFQHTKNSYPFVLLARSSYYDLTKEVYPGFNFEENNNLNNNKNIYDSFNQFGNLEILGEEDLWNCPKCLAKRKIGKSIKIYKAPNYLIIQLKRFKKKSGGFFDFLQGDKNESFVGFPIKNLDLSNYIEGPGKNNGIYNLYAVINHKSLLGYNHYTSFCRNNKKWIEYDDSKINNNIKNPVTNEAYILFYIKKNIDENY